MVLMKLMEMVGEKMASMKSKHVEIFPIDIKLSGLFESTDCVVHRHISEFLPRVLRECKDEKGKPRAAGAGIATSDTLDTCHALLVSGRSDSRGSK